MSPVYRMQCEFEADTQFPRDRIIITPHFHDDGLGTDAQGLVDDLADGFQTMLPAQRGIRVSAYDAEASPPVYPAAVAERDAGSAPQSPVPREIAICLSYYSERNIPRQRGRLYWPSWFLGAASVADRPPLAVRQAIADNLVPLFTGLGGLDVDWVVWSRVTREHHPVTNWWIDDEYDTVRSRGLRPTSRISGETNEAG